ncbi:MAG: RluA family pseudouridine synthase [Oscillospiraceae bacterium]|jgi:23S rRNA pseudouridine1911/1915/1917 synthase|nr:RluA family pseudouridine synthase [Oscillospiraceae bacterium]
MEKKIEILVNKENSGQRIDKLISFIFSKNSEITPPQKVLSNNFDNSNEINSLTRSKFQKLLKNGDVNINGKEIFSKSHKVHTNDKIIFSLPKQELPTAEAENIALDIFYEDDDLLVVNKPRGMVVHPAAGHRCGTLVNALIFHCKDSLSKISGNLRLGIVHRIDKDTSGLLIVAKNDHTHIKLAEQIKQHSFLREYETIVNGNIKKPFGKIIAPIGRDHNNRKRMRVTLKNSKNAITHFRVIQNFKNFSHVSLKLETGRTHQIRVHMANIKHPIVGDFLYGSPKEICKTLNGQCLHAKTIGFVHPSTGRYICIKSDLPEYFRTLLNQLKTSSFC